MSEAQSLEPGLGAGWDKARRELLSAGRNLWLAGLGAVAEVEEGGRDLFGRLVERGRPWEEKQRQAFEKAGEKTQETARELGQLMQDTVEYETQGVLKKLGLLTRDDVKILSARLDTLAQKIEELSAQHRVIVTPDEPATAAAPPARRPRQRKNGEG
jgi:poly(hydroxyalkanoate) granule-associated protein